MQDFREPKVDGTPKSLSSTAFHDTLGRIDPLDAPTRLSLVKICPIPDM